METSKIFSKIKSVFTFINEKILKTNSHVMMRYLVKELLLYFTIAFLWFDDIINLRRDLYDKNT